MANISKIKIIRARHRVISRQIEEAREALAALEAKAKDLETAERVLASLDLEEETDEAAAQDAASVVTDGITKPSGIPTMPEMIFEALRDAKARGVSGLEPKEIAQFIAGRYWPEVTINSVGPIAWRLYSKAKLSKRNSKYSLPKVAQEAGETNAAA
jgi:hypothetical protein